MHRTAPVLFLLAVVPIAHAETKPGDPVRIAVSPAAAPKPSLKYRLLPDGRDLAPGNAATIYYRAMASFTENAPLLKEIREDYWNEWQETPLKDLPKEQMREKLGYTGNLLRELGVAARCKDCDWQLDDRPEGFGLLLPEVQSFRAVANVLAVRARYEIAQGDWDGALNALQTGYALGRHLGRGPTIIHVLVGAAVVRLMDGQVDAFIQQPDAPNLYWALADLPRPFLDPDRAIGQDSRMLENMFPFKRLDGPALSSDEVASFVVKLRRSMDDFGVARPSELEHVAQALFLVQGYGEAKRGLLARGKYTEEQLGEMPSFQVVALHAYLEYRDAFDEVVKWTHVPNGVHRPGFKKSSEQFGEAVARLDRLFFRNLLSSLGEGRNADFLVKVCEAGERTDRRFAALACVEALRMYAAQNGKWPATLEDVTDVPPPNDPATGKPFEYRVQENKAVVAAPSITPGKSDGPDGVTYEVYLRK